MLQVGAKSIAQVLLPENGEIELPIGDDEVPELIIPQAQEPAPKQITETTKKQSTEQTSVSTPGPTTATEKAKVGAPPQTTDAEFESLGKAKIEDLFKTWGELAYAAVKLNPPVYPNEIWAHAKVSLWSDFKDFAEAWEHVLAIQKERQIKAK